MDKNYSNLVYNKIHRKLNFNSICLDSSLEAVADSVTTGHDITTKTPCVDKRIANNPILIKMPNGEIIKSTHIALLPQHCTMLDGRACKLIYSTSDVIMIS